MKKEQRIQVLYTGTVQGVGFRFVAERIASQLGLSGYVRNLPNGGVEAVCEGNEETLKEFLDEIDRHMAGYVSSKEVQWMPSKGEFYSFEIKFL